MGLRTSAFWDYLRTTLWFVPSIFVVVSVALAIVTLNLDSSGYELPNALGFSGSASSARSVLEAIAGAVITLIALAFSITVVVLQLASSQYSPRVLRTFLRDRTSQVVLAVFLSNFVYSMMVLRAVRTESEDGGVPAFIPEASLNIAFILTGASLLLFVLYVHHIARAMQASTIVAEVAEETADAIDRAYPATGKPLADFDKKTSSTIAYQQVVHAERSGYLQAVDEEDVIELARRANTAIELLTRVGDFVPKHSALFRVQNGLNEDQAKRLRGSVTIGNQRTMQQDPIFGLRQLVDIAEKALSPGINDPTTAVQAMDRLHELLLLLSNRNLPISHRADGDGKLRAILPSPNWETYVRLAFDEIRQYGAGSIQVTRRLKWTATSLLETVEDSRKAPLELQIRLIDESARRSFHDWADIEHSQSASRHG